MRKKSKLFIGTSGWQYRTWRGGFYPRELPVKKWLEFIARNFNSVEINSSFYRMPKPEYFKSWAKTASAVNPQFLFSLKLYMWFTRYKKLKLAGEDLRMLRDFLRNAKQLGKNLGSILVQLPPNLKFSAGLLGEFLKQLQKSCTRVKGKFKIAIEFRNKTWLNQETYKILKRYKTAFAISDSPRWPTGVMKTADFVYIRFHGKPQMFASPYSQKDLKKWAKEVLALKPKRIFAYFNNDAWGHAPHDAKKFYSALV